VANDTPFGLSSGICRSEMRRISEERAAGMVTINLPTAGVDYHAFGGRRLVL
jgi:aldehyde dehydrogenase (NAD+)